MSYLLLTLRTLNPPFERLGHVQGPVPHLCVALLRPLVQWQYDPSSSGDCSKGKVGNDDEELDGAQLVHYAHAAADVPRTDALSALILQLRHSVLPSPCLS